MEKMNVSQTILIIEDSDDDYEAAKSALQDGKNFRNPLVRCETGQQGLDYLQGVGKYALPNRPPRPGLILLDLNLPGIDGREVLKILKEDKELRSIPVVVMTTSADERDIDDCYRIGANTYICKPLDWDSFFAAMARLKEYWFEIAVLPPVSK